MNTFNPVQETEVDQKKEGQINIHKEWNSLHHAAAYADDELLIMTLLLPPFCCTNALLYYSDSQPGVRVTPWVRTRTFRGTRKKIE